MDLTRSISNSFSRAAHAYDQFAEVQSYSAHVCGQRIQEMLPSLPSGPILEIGCGTGFLTQQLVQYARDRQLVAADISAEMLDICRFNIENQFGVLADLTFEQIDGQLLASERKFALIAASFSFQWFTDLKVSLGRLLNSLLPGGVIVFCCPTRESFGEWRDACRKTNREFSGNLLPDTESFKTFAADYGCEFNSYELDYVLRFDSPLDFFKSLRSTGANARMKETSSSGNPLIPVVRAWERERHPALVTYRVLFGTLRTSSRTSHGLVQNSAGNEPVCTARTTSSSGL
ncbi:MAG TPA: methyltransferase domain-containing protein [Oculatellaceae cyanobacterium]